MDIEDLIKRVIDAAFVVKRTLGVGFLEQVYKNALAYELEFQGLAVEKEKCLTVKYKDHDVGYYRADLVVDGCLIVELKSTESIIEAYEYQLVNYLRATGISDGLILNFGTTPLGIKRKYRDKK